MEEETKTSVSDQDFKTIKESQNDSNMNAESVAIMNGDTVDGCDNVQTTIGDGESDDKSESITTPSGTESISADQSESITTQSGIENISADKSESITTPSEMESISANQSESITTLSVVESIPTDQSESITTPSEMESVSGIDPSESLSTKSVAEKDGEDEGMETDADVDENLPEDSKLDSGNEQINNDILVNESKNSDDDNNVKNDENVNGGDGEEDKMKNDEKKDKIEDIKEETVEAGGKIKSNEQSGDEKEENNLTIDENQEDKNNDKSMKENCVTEDSQNETKDEDEKKDLCTSTAELDSSTGETEFSQFLSKTPHELEDAEIGIIINDKDILKPEDVFGRGKRSRTPKTDSIYTSEFDADPDYNPKEDMRAQRFVRESRSKQAKQLSDATITCTTTTSKNSPGTPNTCIGTPMKKPKYPNLDIKSLELPGEYGWTREIVVRNTFDDNKRRPADVYYKPPIGKKLRSMVEVSAHLRQHKISDLTENNFSFIKTPISSPPFESVRNAGKPLRIGKKKPEIVIEKDSDEPAIPFNGASCDTETQSVITKSPRGRKRKHSVGPGRPATSTTIIIKQTKDVVPPIEKEDKTDEKVPFLSEMQLQIKTEPVDPEEQDKEAAKEATFPECPPTLEETRTSPSMSPPKKKFFKSKGTARKSTTQKSFKPAISPERNSKLESLCNLNCPGLTGQPPTLQCNVCLCMFHPKCVNMGQTVESFICLRCINKACSPGPDGLMNVPSPALLNCVNITPSSTTGPRLTPVIAPRLTSTSGYMPLNKFLAKALSKTANLNSSTSVATVSPSSTTSSVGNVKIKKEPFDPYENELTGSGVSSSVLGNVRDFLERKASDINQNQSSGKYPVLKEGLQKPPLTASATTQMMYLPVTTSGSLISNSIFRTSLPMGSIPAPMVYNSIPGAAVRPMVSYPSLKPVAPIVQDFISLQPPRLIAAPGTKSHTPSIPDMNGVKQNETNKQGQLLTLPPAVIKRLNLTQPVSLKINNTQVTVPPSSFLHTAQGLKLFLPKNTFPVNTGETAKLSVTVTNDKTLSLDTECGSGQLPTIVPNSSRTLAETPNESPKTRQFKSGINPASCFIQCLYGGFDCMLLIFNYLNVRDLFRVASVCRTWRKLVMHPCLWREVRFRNMKIADWEKAAKYLSRRAVEILDLRGVSHYEDRNKTWHQLISNIHLFTCVHTIHFGAVPGSVLQALCEKTTQLETLSAEWISDSTNEQMKTNPTKLDIGKFSSLADLKVLKLRGISGLALPAFSFSGGISELKSLKHLQKLSLTTLKDFESDKELEFLTSLPNLVHLELGDCTSWTPETYSIIGKLTELQTLRLECGGNSYETGEALKSLRLECGGNSYETGLPEALGNLTKLENLELIEFLIPENLHKTLEKLENLKSLNVWPDTSNQPAAQVNSYTLNTVAKLKSLQQLEWGILSNNNSSIILDGEDMNKQHTQNNQEWIPFLPASDNGYDALSESLTEYISLVNFKEKLTKLLPNTKLNVFSAQTISREEVDS
ncbi:unnamed protein product [Mytilus coruscus]|uniref:Uncharacterized protein n=1 Tax=Mytilus coruscus TaxID=42192 RepID=A0A6J7ZVU6_MYTCO|nr:unnamed protein product [Mytilus coruscus]